MSRTSPAMQEKKNIRPGWSASRLFFLLLLTIRTIQILVGSSSVRFLVENAGSMKNIHFVAFCKLLGLHLQNHLTNIRGTWPNSSAS